MAEQPLEIDVRERTKGHSGPVQVLDDRLFMLLNVLECPVGTDPRSVLEPLKQACERNGANAVIYEDVTNAAGLGILSWSTDPAHFTDALRPALADISKFQLKTDRAFTMLGRTYSTGYEPDLKHWLIDRPIETVCNPEWPWAVWYPLRRSGEFARLAPQEQGSILREHAEIGKAYGSQDLAHDVRLACHGLDAHDNEFVIGLVGKELHPLSHVVQRMRSTRQTSEYINQMGPFFVGKAVARHRVS